MKKILLIATGGTIVSLPSGAGLAPEIAVHDMLRYVPEVMEKYEIFGYQIMNIESPDLEPALWKQMVQTIEENYDNYDGFVITHGTDTLAFTSSALSYMIRDPQKSIVITGSQHSISEKETDAMRNLTDSFLFAAESNMKGVFVVFNKKVMFGNRVKKVYSKSIAAFKSINYPDIARLEKGQILRHLPFDTSNRKTTFLYDCDSRVFVLKLYPGICREDFSFIIEKYHAVIIECYGVGGIPSNFLPLIKEWQEHGLTIAVASQCIYEGSDLGVYTVGYSLLQDDNILQCYDMTLEAALAKLMVALGQTNRKDEIKKIFYTPIQQDILAH